MAPIFTDDDLFENLVPYAKAAARKNGLKYLDQTSFEFGVAYAIASHQVQTGFDDLPIPEESTLIAAAEKHGYLLAGLQPSNEPMSIEENFRSGFISQHLASKSTLHSILKEILAAVACTIAGKERGQVGSTSATHAQASDSELQSVYYSIVIAADRADFGKFLPLPPVETESLGKCNLVREKQSEGEIQHHKLSIVVETPGKDKNIQVEPRKQVSEIDFGSPLCVPVVPDVAALAPLPDNIVLERSELRLYVCNEPDEKTIRIKRLPENPHVWKLGLPPGATTKNSAHVIRAAAARIFLLATVGRKKIQISNLLQVKHKHGHPDERKAPVKIPFQSGMNDHILTLYYAYCTVIMLLSAVVHHVVSVFGFLVLVLAVSKDFHNARNRLNQFASKLGGFWGPQLGLALIGLGLGIYPVTAEMLHVDFISSTLLASIPLLFSFILVSMDFQPKEERDAIKKHEEIHHSLTTHMHNITQTTLSVALGNLERSPKPNTYSYIPEILVAEMDREIGTDEAVDGFEKLIRNRMKSTEITVKRAHEGQQHARRTVMAAGSAVFTGFFAYEVGEAIIHYQHLQSKCDVVSFYYWNFSQIGKAVPASNPPDHTTYANTVSQQHVCSSYEDFHAHELSSTGILLLATLAVSLLTAMIAIRRPSDEHEGNHEHH